MTSAARSPVCTASSDNTRSRRPLQTPRSGTASRASISGSAHVAFAGHGENALRHGAVLRRVQCNVTEDEWMLNSAYRWIAILGRVRLLSRAVSTCRSLAYVKPRRSKPSRAIVPEPCSLVQLLSLVQGTRPRQTCDGPQDGGSEAFTDEPAGDLWDDFLRRHR